MKPHRPLLLLSTIMIGSLALAGCKRDPEPVTPAAPPAAQAPAPAATPEPERPAAAIVVTEVQLGTETTDERTIAEPTTTFSADQDTIIAAVSTSATGGETGLPSSGTLTARWTFEDGQLVDERSERLDFSGQDVTNFRISNPEAWPPGRYTLEISLDDEVVESREFTVE